MTPARAIVALVALAAVVVVVGANASSATRIAEHDYVGAERCKSCHAAEFAAWEASPHARAWQSLSTSERADPRCQSCHTMVPGDPAVELQGVQCESCHGAGRHYSPDWVMRDAELARQLNLVARVDATTCARCHTEGSPAVGPFDFAAKRELIRHWAK
jgi:nitrate/TMAO reductase-like tetraheme cytochrome c subunit